MWKEIAPKKNNNSKVSLQVSVSFFRDAVSAEVCSLQPELIIHRDGLELSQNLGVPVHVVGMPQR